MRLCLCRLRPELPQISILGTSITDYASALGVDPEDWTGATGVNISGTSDLAPIDKQEDMLLELVPDVKQVGILYCSAEVNSEYQAKMFAEELKKTAFPIKNIRRPILMKSSPLSPMR